MNEEMIAKWDLNDAVYKRFATALTWFQEDEKSVLERLMTDYTNSFIKQFRGSADSTEGKKQLTTAHYTKEIPITSCSANECRKLFSEWLSGSRRDDGKPYSKRTVELYANKLANAYKDPFFKNIYMGNLFEITSYNQLIDIKEKILNLPDLKKYSKEPYLFVAALEKYDEFLCVKVRSNIENSSRA